MLNPNDTFRNRRRTNPENPTGMTMTFSQELSLTKMMLRLGISWNVVCQDVLKKSMPMSDCSFFDASRCLIATSVWENRKEAGE